MPRSIVVLDTETTGLNTRKDHIWEIAALRVDYDGGRITSTRRYHAFVQHRSRLAKKLPERFLADYRARFDASQAISKSAARRDLIELFDGRPSLVGAVPSFDAAFMIRLLKGSTPWHYQLRCVETLTAGHLGREAGGLARCLTALSLTANSAEHTAQGDVDAAYRIWQHLMEGEQM